MDWNANMIAQPLAVLFALLGVAHLSGFGSLGALYARWRYPQGFRKVTGMLLALSAALLVFAPTRLAGFAVAALVLFLSATTLLHHRQYGFAAPLIVALFALIPVSLSATV